MNPLIGSAPTSNFVNPFPYIQGLVWTLPKDALHTEVDIPLGTFDFSMRVEQYIVGQVGDLDDDVIRVDALSYKPDGLRLTIYVGVNIPNGAYNLAIAPRGDKRIILPGIIDVVNAGGIKKSNREVYLDSQQKISDLAATGYCSFEDNVTPTIINAVGVWEKINIPSVEGNYHRIRQNGNFTLSYQDDFNLKKTVFVTGTFERSGGGGTRDYEVAVFLQGVKVPNQKNFLEFNTSSGSFAIIADIDFDSSNKDVDVRVRNIQNTNNALFTNSQMKIV